MLQNAGERRRSVLRKEKMTILATPAANSSGARAIHINVSWHKYREEKAYP